MEAEARRLKSRTSNADSFIDAYYRHVEMMLSQLRGVATGDWVELKITEDLDGFEPYCDTWYALRENGVRLSGRDGVAPQICLRPLANFQPPLEIHAQLELEEPDPYPFRAGIGWSREAMKNSNDLLPTQPYFGIMVAQRYDEDAHKMVRHDKARVEQGSGSNGAEYRVATSKAHQLHLKLWPHHAEYFVDDCAWFSMNLPEGLHPEGWLCFGCVGIAGQRDNGLMRWNNLRIRTLEELPPPDASEPAENHTAYWRQRLDEHPSDPFAASEMCRILFERQRYTDVIEVADRLQAEFPKINGFARWKGLALYDGPRDYKAALKQFVLEGDDYHRDIEVCVRHVELLSAAPDDKLRNGRQAKTTAELCQRAGASQNPRVLSALAAASAELGDYKEAIRVQYLAFEHASEEQIADWKVRLNNYESHQPYRLPPAAVQQSSPTESNREPPAP